MGTNRNIGAQEALQVKGNPESFRKLIQNHGQMCKVKQAIACPKCLGANHGAADFNCTICRGQGYIYTYQRRFMVSDELSPCNRSATEFYPYYYPILEVTGIQRMSDERQGGISEIEIDHFDESTIYVKPGQIRNFEANRTTYFFDGWTRVIGDVLKVNAAHGLMWPTQTIYDAKYQSSNPLRAEADIAQVDRIYNSVTGESITDYILVGNTIQTKQPIVDGQMKADYYYADLTTIITADLITKEENEQFTHSLVSGDIRMAIFPWLNLARGDIVVIAADAQYYTEMLVHQSDMDVLFQLECFEINDLILDEDGNKYYRDIDYILDGLHFIRWLTDNQPKKGKIISTRVGYKPAFIVFDDAPERNNLENKKYATIVHAKAWTKTNKNDIQKIMNL